MMTLLIFVGQLSERSSPRHRAIGPLILGRTFEFVPYMGVVAILSCEMDQIFTFRLHYMESWTPIEEWLSV